MSWEHSFYIITLQELCYISYYFYILTLHYLLYRTGGVIQFTLLLTLTYALTTLLASYFYFLTTLLSIVLRKLYQLICCFCYNMTSVTTWQLSILLIVITGQILRGSYKPDIFVFFACKDCEMEGLCCLSMPQFCRNALFR